MRQEKGRNVLDLIVDTVFLAKFAKQWSEIICLVCEQRFTKFDLFLNIFIYRYV
jgi:hypothetical protein